MDHDCGVCGESTLKMNPVRIVWQDGVIYHEACWEKR